MKDKKKTAIKIAIIVVACLVVTTLLIAVLASAIVAYKINNANYGGSNRNESSVDESSMVDESVDESVDVSEDVELVECERVDFDIATNEKNSTEYAVISGYDKDDNRLWQITTKAYGMAQARNFSEIGLRGNRFYYAEYDSIVAIDTYTGKVVWTNDEFGTGDAESIFGRDAIYLTAYFGPCFFAVSYDGETLYSTDIFGVDYCWVDYMELVDDVMNIRVCNEYDREAVIELNLNTFEYVLFEESVACPGDYFGMTFADAKAQYGDDYEFYLGDHGVFYIAFEDLPYSLIFLEGQDFEKMDQIINGNHDVLNDYPVERVEVPIDEPMLLLKGYDLYSTNTSNELSSMYGVVPYEDPLDGNMVVYIELEEYSLKYKWFNEFDVDRPADSVLIYKN